MNTLDIVMTYEAVAAPRAAGLKDLAPARAQLCTAMLLAHQPCADAAFGHAARAGQ